MQIENIFDKCKMMDISNDKSANQVSKPLKEINESDVPILRSFIVLRKEYFGGFMFNPYLPPEIRLDHIRFKIAMLCDGRHTLLEIKNIIGNDLEHSRRYVDELVKGCINLFNNCCAVYWREEKLESPKNFSNLKDYILNGQENKQLSSPLFVIWEVTGACNLRCKHCLSDSGEPRPNELETREAKKLIDALAIMKVFNINFSGGEPLIRSDIFELLEYASQKRIGIDLLTNGALITKEVIDRLENTNIFHVQVSLDGIEKTHDNFRGIDGSYARSIKAIKLLRNANYSVAVSSTVTKQNIDEISKIVDLAIDLGVSVYKTTLFMPAGRGKSKEDELILSPQDVKRFTLMMIRKKKEVGDKITISNEDIYPWLTDNTNNKISDSFKVPGSSKIGCTAGNSSFYITPDGKITPCPFLRKFIAGDIREKNIKEIWNNSPIFDIFRNITRGDLKGKCSECEYLGVLCFGGCRASAFANKGDLYAEDPLCWKPIT
ncbi:MAG: radical SAM protein [Candidatus Hodarchaeota archaeon]